MKGWPLIRRDACACRLWYGRRPGHHQALLGRDDQAQLDAELIEVARLALGYELDLRGVHGVGLLLFFGLLADDAPGAPFCRADDGILGEVAAE